MFEQNTEQKQERRSLDVTARKQLEAERPAGVVHDRAVAIVRPNQPTREPGVAEGRRDPEI